MFGLGPLEILVILALALLVFGRRLPEVGRSVGRSIVEFKKGLAGMEDELRQTDTPSEPSSSQPPAATGSQTPPQLDAQANPTTHAASSQQPAAQDQSQTH